LYHAAAPVETVTFTLHGEQDSGDFKDEPESKK
jgi:hypothetical protein